MEGWGKWKNTISVPIPVTIIRPGNHLHSRVTVKLPENDRPEVHWHASSVCRHHLTPVRHYQCSSEDTHDSIPHNRVETVRRVLAEVRERLVLLNLGCSQRCAG